MTASAKSVDRGRLNARFLKAGGEDGVVDRLQLQYGEVVDVARWVDWAIDFRRRKTVQNLTGLLVTKVREQAAAVIANAPRNQEALRIEAERYAAFSVHLYQVISEQGLRPNQVAEMLEQAVKNGYPRLSRPVMDRLRLLGDRWPGS